MQLVHALPGLDHQIVVVAVLDGSGRARLGAGRGLAVPDPVVAQRAFLGDALVGHAGMFVARCVGGKRAVRTPFDDAERAAGHAGAAPVAHIGLHHDGAELGAEQRPGGAHVQAAGVRAVLAHIRRHQPAELVGVRRRDVHRGRSRGRAHPRHAQPDQCPTGFPCLLDVLAALLDERDVPPGAGTERTGVVVRGTEQLQIAVPRDSVPLLAGDLAGLAADADRGVGEETLALPRLRPVGVARRVGRPAQLMRQSRLVRMARRMAR